MIGFSGDESHRMAVNFDHNTAVLFNRHEEGDSMTLLNVPFYIAQEKSNLTYGLFFDTTAPMEVRFLPTPAITVRVLDGSLNIYVFEGETKILHR
jgi:hypothetical protein